MVASSISGNDSGICNWPNLAAAAAETMKGEVPGLSS